MANFDELLLRLRTLRERGVGGEALGEALDLFLSGAQATVDGIDALRMLYVECESSRALARWALSELDAEVHELEQAGLAH